MDWIRRNWPDLLIGIALVAVIAGIIATLLTGGSFFPLGQSDRAESRQSQSNFGPIAGTVEAGVRGQSSDNGTEGTGGNPEGASGNDSTAAGETSSSAGLNDDGPVGVTVLPLPGTNSDVGNPGTVNDSPAGSTEGDPGGDAADSRGDGAAATTAVTETPTDSGGEVRSAAQELPETSGTDAPGTYRVSVGAFSAAENAERQAATFRQAGFPVFIGTQGGLSIVLVGPYDERAQAERVAEQIRAGEFDIEPVIYLFTPDDDTSATTGGQQPTAEVSSQPQSAATTAPASSGTSANTASITETASEAAGARFLQVGAYGSADSAQPQRVRLEGLGFRVTERIEGDLVKLLVGPFAGDNLAAARSRLNEQGIEHFPR